jgi:WD40 repeat protein
MQTLKGHKGKLRALAFAPASNHLVSVAGHGNSISLWDLARGKRTYLSGLHGTPLQLTFSRSGDRLVARDDDAIINIRDPRAADWPILHRYNGNQAALIGPQQTFTWTEPQAGKECHLRFLDLATGDTPYPDHVLPWRGFGITQLAATPDGKTLGLAVYDNERNQPPVVAFVRLGPTVERGQPLPLDAIPHAALFSLDGTILTISTTQSIQRFNTATAEPLPALKDHTRMVTGLAYLPDGRLLSCSTDATVRTWDVQSGKCLDVKEWKLGPLTALAVAADGMRAAVGCDNGDIFLWDLD